MDEIVPPVFRAAFDSRSVRIEYLSKGFSHRTDLGADTPMFVRQHVEVLLERLGRFGDTSQVTIAIPEKTWQ